MILTLELRPRELARALWRLKCHIWLVALATLAVPTRNAVPQTPPARDRSSIEIQTRLIPLNQNDPAQDRIGAFVYAGGIEIQGIGSVGTSRLHGLSDLEVLPGNRLLAVTDEGQLFEALLAFDKVDRLSGLTRPRLSPLVDERGRALGNKSRADAEGLAVMPNGDRLVSFEREHRIWLYPRGDGLPRPAPMPSIRFPSNGGMEALTAYPFAGAGAYLVGSEGGKVWLCEVTKACQEEFIGNFPRSGFGLTGIATFGDAGALALLGRMYDSNRGITRIDVRLAARPAENGGRWRVLDEMTLMAPLTRDNFEGIAVVSQPGGALRIYLLSDDNFSKAQHTYLLAFDWNPTARSVFGVVPR